MAAKRRLKVDLASLEAAFASSDPDSESYLDLDTGEVILVTEEMQSLYETVSDDAEAGGTSFDEALAASGQAEWMKIAVAWVARVEESPATYLPVPQSDSREDFRDMEAFAASVPSSPLRDRLFDALGGGRGPFRRFRGVLDDYPNERARWMTFKDERIRRRVLTWLEAEGIEFIE